MTTLDSGFEDALADSLLDGLEARIRAVGDELKAVAEDNFKQYAARNGYDIDHVWTDAEGPFVERDARSVTVRVEWPGLTALFEFGVDPHEITGDLAFEWAGPPEGTRPEGAPAFVQTQSVDWGSVTGGIPAARAIRNAIEAQRADLQGGP